jgi:probable F420-dependent oxidoreductase
MNTTLRLGIGFTGENLPIERIVELGVAAESAGMDSVWHVENQREPWVPLSVIASRTNRIRIGTGLALWARSPQLAELAAVDLDELSRGRFLFGIGTAPREWNENWHGISYENPVQRMREYVEIIRLMWTAHSGNTIGYDGEKFTIRDYQRAMKPYRERIPVYLGAVQRRMCALCGEIADGVLLNVLTTPRYVREYALGYVSDGLKRSGRRRQDIEVGTVVIGAVDGNAAEARRWARHQLAYYAVIPYFDVILNLHGFQREAGQVREAAARGDADAMIEAVTDEMVDTLAVAGTPDACRARLAEFAEAGVQLAVFYPPAFRLGSDEIEANVNAMLEAFGGS